MTAHDHAPGTADGARGQHARTIMRAEFRNGIIPIEVSLQVHAVLRCSRWAYLVEELHALRA